MKQSFKEYCVPKQERGNKNRALLALLMSLFAKEDSKSSKA